jgi:DNA-binding HxlR family transcriptional regulator
MNNTAEPERGEIAQRAIVMQLLSDEHRGPWTRSELARAIPDIDPRAVGEALVQLAAEEVAILEGQRVRASRCAWRLDALEMVTI